jgi:hypothetical protein
MVLPNGAIIDLKAEMMGAGEAPGRSSLGTAPADGS